MLKPVSSFPKNAKAWVYLSNRPFTISEKAWIENNLESFAENWEAHGTGLEAGFELIDNQIISIFVDEQNQHATGCSIDKSVSKIKEIESKLNLSLSDRSLVGYYFNNEIRTTHFSKVKTLVENGEIHQDTIIVNLNLTQLGEVETELKQKAKESWLSKYFK